MMYGWPLWKLEVIALEVAVVLIALGLACSVSVRAGRGPLTDGQQRAMLFGLVLAATVTLQVSLVCCLMQRAAGHYSSRLLMALMLVLIARYLILGLAGLLLVLAGRRAWRGSRLGRPKVPAVLVQMPLGVTAIMLLATAWVL